LVNIYGQMPNSKRKMYFFPNGLEERFGGGIGMDDAMGRGLLDGAGARVNVGKKGSAIQRYGDSDNVGTHDRGNMGRLV
jgi:hypothetical protein